ncbi:MAG: bifunctional oligoribonuclease/PAP phosphatase NrnA [Tissierellia bacterium]|nr:bifunctional oligoribonuclease/PAP phosphatase NrnA [Tissierellia bacterium]
MADVTLKEKAARFLGLVEGAQSIVLASHVNPDGDNLGSSGAMFDFICHQWPDKDLYFLHNDRVPKEFGFLPHMDRRVEPKDLDLDPDLFIALDSSDEKRMGEEALDLFNRAKKRVNIDHHASNTAYGDLNIVQKDQTSTGELLMDLFKLLDYSVSPQGATALYTAISSDTGNFQYDSVTAKTHRNIADLLESGAEFYKVTQALYQSKTPEKMALYLKCMERLEYHQEGLVSLAYIKNEDFKETGAYRSDTEGFVEELRNIKSVELAVFLVEREGYVKFSLRSKNWLDCTKIAESFGGGGHIRASGGSIDGSIEEARQALLERIKEVFYERHSDC